jgi:hypothetical protein
MSEYPKVYGAIAQVMADLATHGIGKENKNAQQGYNFRGIDDIYNALARHLSNAKLCILPRVIRREVVERQTRNGAALFYVTCDVEFDFVSAEDGSKHTVAVVGEAMDSADKATNKAMSAAYKYCCLQTFCIPTKGDNDADGTTHDVQGLVDKLRKVAEYIKEGISRDDDLAVLEAWEGLTEPEMKAIWIAESKGGYFTQAEKQYIRAAKHKAYTDNALEEVAA